MSAKKYYVFTLVVFTVVGVAHALRAFNGWEVLIGGWVMPLWASWLAALLALLFVWSASKLLKR
jgi:hypothetical protein